MKELIEYNLIYGRLLTVSEPFLIERYNKALEAFGLPRTKLESFQIDMSGHSPQIAEELDITFYLERDISRRRFIIVAPEQENLPVIGARFSNTAALLHVFFEKNRRVIQAATIKDVLFGEIDDNLVEIQDITDLMAIEQVTFRVLSSEETLFKAEKLRRRIDRLMTVQGAWRDDEMLEEMVDPHERSRARSARLSSRELLSRPLWRCLRLQGRQEVHDRLRQQGAGLPPC
jgi:hypothetical protein